jgi:lantibiotic modifying enzyme
MGTVFSKASLVSDEQAFRDLLQRAAMLVGKGLTAAEDSPSGDATDVYGGPPGVALFWAALAATSSENQVECRARCLAWLAGTRRLVGEGRGFSPGSPMGGLHGAGAVVYALTVAGVLLESEELLTEAITAATEITAELIAEDRSFDVVAGVAGFLLAVTALTEVVGPHHHLSSLRASCEHHLRQHRQDWGGGGSGWPSASDDPPFCGFAHGASGIAYALLRGSAEQEPSELVDVIASIFRFERRLFRPEVGNWAPSSRFPAAARPLCAWCWGAPGIALARAAAVDRFAAVDAQLDLDRALETLLAMPQTLEDHLCCGNLGRACLLAYFGGRAVRLGRTEEAVRLRGAAEALVRRVLGTARGRGAFLYSVERELSSPPVTLLKGAAGVGYGLLYLAYPERLPLLLAFEPPRRLQESPELQGAL